MVTLKRPALVSSVNLLEGTAILQSLVVSQELAGIRSSTPVVEKRRQRFPAKP